MYDVIVIGAGVTGCAAARELSRYKIRGCVLEREADIGCGTSKANSAIIHAGYDAPEGSLMARFNVEGNERMDQLSKELDFPFQRNGSLVVCLDEEDKGNLRELYKRGIKNGVKGLQILSGEEARALEPNLSAQVIEALYAPSGGIVCPFEMTIAYAENAEANGMEFLFETEVREIEKRDGVYELRTNHGIMKARCIVNAAGVYADVFHNMVCRKKIRIIPRKGEYCLFDKASGAHVSKTIFQVPGKYGKGVLVTPTVHGNLLAGPTAEDIEDKEAVSTTREGMESLLAKASMTVKSLPFQQVITSFAGLRAHEEGHEFIIGEAEDAEGFFDAAGIESPGLSSAPAIGIRLAELIQKKLHLEEKEEFAAERKGILNPHTLSREEWKELIREKPEYGRIVCRCEMVTEGEILEAIHRIPGRVTLDGIKRRTRAGMGRCQAGFCTPGVMELIAEECREKMTQITKAGKGSELLTGMSKEAKEGETSEAV